MTKRKLLCPFAIPLTAEYFTLVEHVTKNKFYPCNIIDLVRIPYGIPVLVAFTFLEDKLFCLQMNNGAGFMYIFKSNRLMYNVLFLLQLRRS